ncbi:MAG: hypothetical protein ACKV2Q_36585 [Planctomycetaceae bacterium]
MTTYQTQWGADEITVSADWSEAACQVDGCDGMQVADFRHDEKRAMRYALLRAAEADGTRHDDDIDEQIDAAISDMVEVDDVDEIVPDSDQDYAYGY